MERTISGMIGKGSVSHNTRAFSAKNVDRERSKDNVCFHNEDIKKVYYQLFNGALERYNAKQKRSDRKIENYYEKIRTGKQERLFHEVIFQIGNREDMNARNWEGDLAKEILTEFMKDFQTRNPNLYVFSAHLHMDEETPHLHIDFIPFIRNSKRGLDTRVSLKGALAEQGFKGGTRGATEWNQWIDIEKQELAKVMGRCGVEWKRLGTHNKHLSVLDYEKQERTREVRELMEKIQEEKVELQNTFFQQIAVKEEIAAINEEADKYKQDKEYLEVDKYLLKIDCEELAEKNEKLSHGNKELREERQNLVEDIEKLAGTKNVIHRNVREYEVKEEWKLPEPERFMSTSAFREQKALPLVERLKKLVKSLTAQCLELLEKVKSLSARVRNQQEEISNLTDKLMEQQIILEDLREEVRDFKRIRKYVGDDKINLILKNAKELERIERDGNFQPQFSAKYDSKNR